MSSQLVLELPRTSQAPGIARRWLAESFADELDDLAHENAKLLLSELVTNAVVHGRGRVQIRARLDRDRLVVDVIDEGPAFTPPARERDPGVAGGRGLWIVDAQASRWGIREGAADVWFELPRHPAAPAGLTGDADPNARASTEPRPAPAGSSGRLGRAERVALYARVADTLERSAELAEQHAERERHFGRQYAASVELERGERAREAARQGRALASKLP